MNNSELIEHIARQMQLKGIDKYHIQFINQQLASGRILTPAYNEYFFLKGVFVPENCTTILRISGDNDIVDCDNDSYKNIQYSKFFTGLISTEILRKTGQTEEYDFTVSINFIKVTPI